MERTLFPNDYVLVNKIKYGTKVPKRFQDLPIIGSFFQQKGLLLDFDLYKSLKPFENYAREDIVVFKSIEENDMFLIKRIIGLPNDSLKIINSKVYINNLQISDKALYCFDYVFNAKNDKKIIETYSNEEFSNLGENYRKTLVKNIKKTYTNTTSLFPYPFTKEKKWTRDNYGELVIPKKGMKIILDKDTFEIYKSILINFENQNFEISIGKTKSYVFKNNYYFLMGDNRHNSEDSRNFGFIPESYIQGKMIATFSQKRLFK